MTKIIKGEITELSTIDSLYRIIKFYYYERIIIQSNYFDSYAYANDLNNVLQDLDISDLSDIETESEDENDSQLNKMDIESDSGSESRLNQKVNRKVILEMLKSNQLIHIYQSF